MAGRRHVDDEAGLLATPLDLPYLMGVYLVANAIRDVWLVVDGPDCSHFKGQFIFRKHDWYSTLYRTDGRHRILFTGTNAQNVAEDRDALIGRILRRAMVDEAGAVLLTSMPLCGILGAQYDRIIAGIAAERPVVEVPGLSLRGDWLDGFAEALRAIARRKALPRARRRRNAIAVVGYLMDRNEGDHTGNLSELGRLLGALGLELVSVWPGGSSWADLDRVAEAGTIVSLPYGRAAAATLAARTGARLVETEVPIGLGGTRRWIEAVATATRRLPACRKLVATELDRASDRLGRIVPFYFLNRGAAIIADPHLAGGLAEFCTDLGMHVRFIAAVGREGHAPAGLGPGVEPGVSVRSERVTLEPGLRPGPSAGLGPADLVVCPGDAVMQFRPACATVELGVPSSTHHVIADSPFLGFDGALRIANRFANALAAAFRTRTDGRSR